MKVLSSQVDFSFGRVPMRASLALGTFLLIFPFTSVVYAQAPAATANPTSSSAASPTPGPKAGQGTANSNESIEQILNNAKKALNGGTLDSEKANGKSNDHAEAAARPRKKIVKAPAGAPSPAPLVETQPLPADQAQSILKMDLDSIAREGQPKDPQFTAYVGFGQMSAQSNLTLTKDDDNFALDHASRLSGGELQLKTSWQIVRFNNERFGLHFLIRGSGGTYSGDASVDRTGVQNQALTETYRVSPFALALGPELEFEHRFHLGITLGPTLDIVSISGSGQTDTLTQVFTGDRLQISLGTTFLRNWDAEVSLFQSGILNHNVTDNGVILAVGYAISG